MIQRFCRPLARRLDGLDDRRWLLAIVLTLVISYLLFYVLIVAPIASSKGNAQAALASQTERFNKLSADTQKLEVEIGQLQLNIDQAVSAAGLNASADLSKQVSEMRGQITDLIEAGDIENAMAVLDTLLTEASGLKVASLKLAGTETVVEENDNAPAVYRHELEVIAHGGYFDVVNYLEALNELKGSTHIANVSYVVKEWPNAEVVVRISAFSTREEWIDVDS